MQLYYFTSGVIILFNVPIVSVFIAKWASFAAICYMRVRIYVLVLWYMIAGYSSPQA